MIKYNFTKEDFAEFNKYYLKHRAPFLLRYMKYFFLLLVVYVLYNLKDIFLDEKLRAQLDLTYLWPIVGVILVLSALFLRGNNTYVNVFSKRYAQNNPQLFGPREIELTEDKLICKTDAALSEYNYTGFIGLVEQPLYYFIMVSKQMAIIIPKHAITEKTDEELLKKKIKPLAK